MKEPQPTISKGLQEALGEIEKGAQERMEVLQAKKERLEMGKSAVETVPKLIGHIEKVEEEEIEEGVEGSGVVQKKGDDGTRRKIMKGATVGEERSPTNGGASGWYKRQHKRGLKEKTKEYPIGS